MTKLRWKTFERETWRRIRAELRASTQGWKEYRRRWWAKWFASSSFEDSLALRIVAPMALFVMCAAIDRDSSARSAGFFLLWVVGSVFRRVGGLNAALYEGASLPIYNHFPISNVEIFRLQFRVWCRQSMWTVVDLAIMSLLLFRTAGDSTRLWLALGVAMFQWLFIMCLAVMIAAWKTRSRYQGVGFLLRGAAFLYVFKWFPDSLALFIGNVAGWLPPVSLAVWFMAGIKQGESGVIPILPAACALGAVLIGGWVARRRLQSCFSLTENDYDAERLRARKIASIQLGQKELVTVRVGDVPSAPTPIESESDAEAAVRAGLRTQAFDWCVAPLVERAVGGILTTRERAIAELLVHGRPHWTGKLQWLAGWCGFALVVLAWDEDYAFLASLPMFFLMCKHFAGWGGLAANYASGAHLPPFAWHPISIDEVGRVMIKINWMRAATCIPLLAVFLVALVWQRHLPGQLALLIGSKTVFLVLIGMPLLAAGQFQFSQSRVLREFISLALGGVFIISFFAVAIMFCVVTNVWGLLGLGISLIALDVLAVQTCRRWFNRGRVDFIIKNPMGAQTVLGSE